MTNEFKVLTLLIGLHLIVWLPYIMNMILRTGLFEAMGYSQSLKALSPWAERMKKAHYNAVENHWIYLGLVFLLDSQGKFNHITSTASIYYLVSRVIHLLSYTFAIPYVRTLSFMTSMAALVVIFTQLC